tara:strand:+ start:5047 stop:6216 length:1170 start_codon:yes stop_codon:yes gene_type:complete
MNKKTDAFNNKKIKVPFVVPTINSNDKTQILKALSSNLLTDGPNLREFEKKFQKYTKSEFSTGVSNATAGLMLSLKALNISENDEVIIPDMTFVATANAVLSCNATPVLADVNYEDLNISIKSIEENITNRTRAIIPVHFAGKSCNMKQIMRIAKKYDLKIVEDCAHALGTFYDKKHVGTFGDTGCFSFYPTKNLTTFEGGMITSKAKKITEILRKSRNHGINKSLKDRFTRGHPWEFDIKELGFNFRLDEIRSALGNNQLKRLGNMNNQRRSAAKYYHSKLKDVKGISLPSQKLSADNSWHLYVIKILDNFAISRNSLFHSLLSNGIRTSVHYKPLHLFSLYKKTCKITSSLRNSKKLYQEILSLPMFPSITRRQQNLVISEIKKKIK